MCSHYLPVHNAGHLIPSMLLCFLRNDGRQYMARNPSGHLLIYVQFTAKLVTGNIKVQDRV